MSLEFASEIYSSSIPGSEEVQEKTVDLQPDEQETHSNEQETHHTSSTQTEVLIYIRLWNLCLLRTVHEMTPQLKQKSLTSCLPSQ